MTTIFIDGFDKYGPPGQTSSILTTLLQQEWTTATASATIVAALSSTGYAINAVNPNAAFLTKTLPSNYSRLIGGARFSGNLTSNCAVIFLDGGTAQCSVVINTTGTIGIRTGAIGGTVITTSTASVSASTIHYLEWDITFGASASYQCWLDGTSIFSGTGNTKTTGNSTANQIQFWCGGSAASITFDDLYLFDSTTSFNNAVLLTSPQIITQFPISDSQTQFTNNGSILGTAYSATASTNAPGANQIFLRKFTSAVAQTINSVSIIPQATSAGAKFKAVIYPDSGGSPNGQAIMSSGTEVVGATSGTTLTGALVTPQGLSASIPYWIGFITDTSVVLQETDTTTTGVKAANTYASGAPATCPTVTTGQNSWNIWGNCTGAATNWEAVDLIPAPGDINSIVSSTVGNEDLYAFSALPGAITAVYTVGVKGNIKRSDSGARTVDLRTSSSGNDSGGSTTGQTPGTTYGWLDSYFDTDPNTSAAWGVSAANAALAGPKVAS